MESLLCAISQKVETYNYDTNIVKIYFVAYPDSIRIELLITVAVMLNSNFNRNKICACLAFVDVEIRFCRVPSTSIQFLRASFREHRNEMILPLDGFWPLWKGEDRHLAVKVFKIETKISLTKLWVVCVIRKNNRQKETRFYVFCVYERRTE